MVKVLEVVLGNTGKRRWTVIDLHVSFFKDNRAREMPKASRIQGVYSPPMGGELGIRG
jgi:hypothetical protein